MEQVVETMPCIDAGQRQTELTCRSDVQGIDGEANTGEAVRRPDCLALMGEAGGRCVSISIVN